MCYSGKLRPFYFLTLFLSFSISVSATTIIPPSDIGQMAYDSDYILYGTVTGHHEKKKHENLFEIARVVKGDLQAGDRIVVDEYAASFRGMQAVISGDTDYKIGTNYLIFLFKTSNGHYKSRLLSLSVYEEAIVGNTRIFAHESSLKDLAIAGTKNIDGLKATYRVDDLLKHLDQVIAGSHNWDESTAGIISLDPNTETDLESPFTEYSRIECPNARPSHCTTLIGDETALSTTCTANSPAKYQSASPCAAPVFSVCVSSEVSEDPSIMNELVIAETATAELNAMSGIEVTYDGVATCDTMGNCMSIANTALNCPNNPTSTKLWVFFDDPCSEINDLSGCSGTLAIGGSFAFSGQGGAPVCHTDCCGNMWRPSAVPFFVMNNGSGCVGEYSYTAIMVHEMLHGMGLDHIGGDCTALMNGLLCNDNASAPQAPNFGITDLDTDCTEWMYNASPIVPIELGSFSAEKKNDYVSLSWTTRSETNNDYFTVERSADGRKWHELAIVEGAGNSSESKEYITYDLKPIQGKNYYRLKQTDYNGRYTYSGQQMVEMGGEEDLVIFPNPVNASTLSFSGVEVRSLGGVARIYDVQGALKNETMINKRLSHSEDFKLDVSSLGPGTYFLEIVGTQKRHVRKFLVK